MKKLIYIGEAKYEDCDDNLLCSRENSINCRMAWDAFGWWDDRYGSDRDHHMHAVRMLFIRFDRIFTDSGREALMYSYFSAN